MNRPLSLLFAVIGTLLLCTIPLAMSFNSILWTLLAAAASILFIGFGFVLKARMRRNGK